MTGSLQVKNDWYYAVLNVKDESGKAKKKWISLHLPVKGTPKKLAKNALQDVCNKYVIYDNIFDSNVLFCDYVRYWIKTYADERRVEEITIQGYQQMIDTHILPYFENRKIKLQDVTPSILERFYSNEMKNGRLDGKGGVSVSSIRHYHAIMKNVFRMAYNNMLIPYNPTDRVELPKQTDKYVGKAYTPEQMMQMLEIIKNESIYALVLVTAFFGLRLSEVCALKWDAIDFCNKTVEIKRTVVQMKTIIQKERTKSNSSHRVYPLPDFVEDVLLQTKAKQNNWMKLFKSEYTNFGFVFTNEFGKMMNPQTVSTKFRKVLKKYNLEHIRFHDLRHTCASLLINNGAELKDVSDWLGHSNISITANTYGHIYQKHKQEIANDLSSVFADNNKKIF